jgi:hypothetical protein
LSGTGGSGDLLDHDDRIDGTIVDPLVGIATRDRFALQPSSRT